MSLRVGYVNVHGLGSRQKWDLCTKMLGSTFDIMFLAETWFIQHSTYIQERPWIASTTLGPLNLLGRQAGGIYLVGTATAKSRVQGIQVSQYSITCLIDGHTITGVYYPPQTLTTADMQVQLQNIRRSTVVVGDINTRFPPHYGHGPADRVRAFNEWSTEHDFLRTPVNVTVQSHGGVRRLPECTIDHCFVKSSVRKVELELWSTTDLKIHTDHKYLLYLTISAATPRQKADRPCRFRLNRLTSPTCRARVVSTVNRMTRYKLRHHLAEWTTENIDSFHTQILELYQHLARTTLGEKKQRPSQSRKAWKRNPRDSVRGMTSIQLYKQACENSQENDILHPTKSAQGQGQDAVRENVEILSARYHSAEERPVVPVVGYTDTENPITQEKLVAEIQLQAAARAADTDGVHIQLLKVLAETEFMTLLTRLFWRCGQQGVTPQAWNRSDIYLLTKDLHRPRDADNVRPIAIIAIFRKLFERLMWQEWQTQAWATLHPAQAGFRSEYSTLTNAVRIHEHLTTYPQATAVFLDFRSAFDVMSHRKMVNVLRTRGCPPPILSLLHALSLSPRQSRAVANGTVSEWFTQYRGVPQGGPGSSLCFNIYIDSLLARVNQGYDRPVCQFYADDGCLLTTPQISTQRLLDIIYQWGQEFDLELHPKKTQFLTRQPGLTLHINHQPIAQCDQYSYLGFPVKATGIDFAAHVHERIQAACGRVKFLSIYSDSWGVAHRLRIYKTYLAPMWEYGAPLVAAWSEQRRGRRKPYKQALLDAFQPHDQIVEWISNGKSTTKIDTNLCGLIPLPQRFAHLHAKFSELVRNLPDHNPLYQILYRSSVTKGSFIQLLRDNALFATWKATLPSRISLSQFLQSERKQTILKTMCKTPPKLLTLTPAHTRLTKDLRLADWSLSSQLTIKEQDLLYSYRRGKFGQGCFCICGMPWKRGHESCPILKCRMQLTVAERQKKDNIKQTHKIRGVFTHLDFLLWTKQLQRAAVYIRQLWQRLNEVFRERMFTTDDDGDMVMTS
jgi:hypothetical protein